VSRRPGPRKWLVREITRMLTTPLPHYERRVANDLDKLKRHARKCDVILVDGDERVSLVIKYLTQSSWSHVAVYVGDEPLRRDPERRAELEAAFGDEAEHLIVEALMEGVVLSPLSKYLRHNMRVCRPTSLRREDRDRVLDELLSRVGHQYDLKNIVDLARYFFPVSLVPRRFRARALTIGSGEPTAVICSSMIAAAFQNVGFPILPRVERVDEPPVPANPLVRVFRRGANRASRFFKQPPPMVTPRDFDLSPYFEIVKFNLFEEVRFDYRKIVWADRDDAANS
jgi:permuted papain-like amidase YaeF/Yiix C92 family enzyme